MNRKGKILEGLGKGSFCSSGGNTPFLTKLLMSWCNFSIAILHPACSFHLKPWAVLSKAESVLTLSINAFEMFFLSKSQGPLV